METISGASERVPEKRLERRRNLHLRERFDAAATLLRPLLGTPESQNGAAFFKAMNRLHTAYPDLTPSDIEALVAAVVRGFQTRPGG